MPLTYSSKNATFTQDLRSLHDYLRKEHPFIERISVALYDDATDMLKTYSNSTYGTNPLKFYEFPLGKSASLSESYRTRSPRIIDDLENLTGSAKQTHSQKIYQSGYRSSYTYPIFFMTSFSALSFSMPKNLRFFPKKSPTV